MILRFFSWWARELGALLPHRPTTPDRRRMGTLVVRESGDAYDVHRVSGRGERHIARAPKSDPDAAPVRLRRCRPASTRVLAPVAAINVLQTEVQLPRAAAENLREVLRYEMERLTPFRADEVVFDAEILDPGGRSNLMRVQLRVLPRRTVAAIPQLMRRWGFTLDPAQARIQPHEDAFAVAWTPPAPSARGRSRALAAGVWMLNLALLGVAVGLPLWTQQQTLDELRDRLTAAREAAAATTALRSRVEALQEELDFLASLKVESTPTVELLEAITQLLPDDTWLRRLQLKNGMLFLQGTSAASSNLIPVLDASPLFTDVRFSAPVTRASGGGGEQFNIAATVVPLLSREPPPAGAAAPPGSEPSR